MRALLLALLAVVVLGPGCTEDAADDARQPAGRGDGAAEADGSRAEGAAPTTSPPRRSGRAVPPDPLDPELAAALLEAGPPGWSLDPEPPATGPLDLRAAARAEPDRQAERAVLETRGFRRGFARTWRGPDGQVAVATTYQFADPGGAAAYLEDGRLSLEGFAAEGVAVPDVPGALGFSTTAGGAERQRVVHGVAFTRGPRFFLVLASGDGSDVGVRDAVDLATAQAAQAGAVPAVP